jgi:hypothetical protein
VISAESEPVAIEVRMDRWIGRGVTLGLLCCLVLTTSGCGEGTTDARIRDTMRRTEDIRGLSALEPIPYRFVGADTAFDDLLADWRDSDAARETEAEALVLERLGVLPRDFDILEVLEWSTRTGVLGYYDPETKHMTVVADGSEVGDGELMVLAHEHAHALQDQHFGLGAGDTLDDEAALALDALAEGEATLVMAIWVSKRLGAAGLEDLETADIPTDTMPVSWVPDILYRAGEFPYIDGSAFVYDVFEDGGWEAVDALWEDPPVSSEQIMHPERYPEDMPEIVDLPDIAGALGTDWELAKVMVIGEMQIGVLLADGASWDDGDSDEAFSFPLLENAHAAEGWGGDRLLHLTGPDDDWAIVWQTTWDRTTDAQEFAKAAQAAFVDLPFAWQVREGDDVSTGALPHPVLVLVTPDEDAQARLQAVLELARGGAWGRA